MSLDFSVLVAELNSEGPGTVLSLTLSRSGCLGMSICHTSFSHTPSLCFSGLKLLALVVVSLLIKDEFLKGVNHKELMDSNTFVFLP